MPRTVALVTDSTAQLPLRVRTRRDITAVPLTVVVNGSALPDGAEEASRRLVPALRQRQPVTTSRPSPETFAATYRAAARAGARSVVSVHLSSAISGTYDAAVLAARDAPLPVRVVDSGMIAMALGFAVLAAADTADAGGDTDTVARAAAARAAATRAYFSVDTLDHLRRGGRINRAQALLGSALAVKPLLEMNEGSIVLREEVRTTEKATARLAELAAARADGNPVVVAVHHLGAAERAADLAERLRDRLPDGPYPLVSEVGAVLGAHTGPGLLGVVVAPAG